MSQLEVVNQFVELPKEDEEEGRNNDSPEPIVEVKHTSGSSDSSQSSAATSPVSSRQSSDCDHAASSQQRRNKQTLAPATTQLAHSTSSSSSSSSSSSASSRRLIRRRTVKRSYHHRAANSIEDSAGVLSQKPSSSSFVQTTTTTHTTSASKSDNKDGADKDGLVAAGEPHFEVVRRYSNDGSATAPDRDDNCALITVERQQKQGLSPALKGASHTSSSSSSSSSSTSSLLAFKSTSKSSSRIATVTRSTSNGQKANDKQQLALKPYQPQHQQRQGEGAPEDAMTSSRLLLSGAESNLGSSFNEEEELLQQQQQQQSLFERRSRSATMTGGQSANSAFSAAQSDLSSKLQHRHLVTGSLTVPASLSSATSTSCETSLSHSATRRTTSSTSSSRTLIGGQSQQKQQRQQQQQHLQQQQHRTTSASSDHSLSTSSKTSSSSLLFHSSAAAAVSRQRPFLATPDNLLFSPPDVRSLVLELGTDFAQLESALTTTSSCSSSLMVREHQAAATRVAGRLSSRLFGGFQQAQTTLEAPASGDQPESLDSLIQETNSTIRELEDNPPLSGLRQAGPAPLESKHFSSIAKVATDHPSAREVAVDAPTKIRELMNKAQRHNSSADELKSSADTSAQTLPPPTAPTNDGGDDANRRKAVMNESIERIDQRVSDLCRKFEACQDTQSAINMLKIIIQMIEYAWSVPVCGDDLGFKLCNSLRQLGSLDLILAYIREADERALLKSLDDCHNQGRHQKSGPPVAEAALREQRQAGGELVRNPSLTQGKQRQLKLNLSKLTNHQRRFGSAENEGETPRVEALGLTTGRNDDDSDVVSSDLGLDSASLDSLPTAATAPGAVLQTPPPSDESSADSAPATTIPETKPPPEASNANEQPRESADEEMLERVRKEELTFLSARLLSQCLTSDNRDYIVRLSASGGALDSVIKLAFNFTTMKSRQSKRLLRRSTALMRQASTIRQQEAGERAGGAEHEHEHEHEHETSVASPAEGWPPAQVASAPSSASTLEANSIDQPPGAEANASDQQQQHEQRSDMHSAIGTEILQHLFKHSEETCSRMTTLGALQAVLYGCRSSHVETLRNCASALANLALYGGSDSQQTMIEHKAHVWLFPLAFNEDDHVQYYACLAIVVLAANQEIEADVLKSSTLDLVEPFVTSHEPRRFAESTTSHIHGQSANWLQKLMPLLDSKREEARNLACFHFAMEAHIKREQGQTELFRRIGAIEPLRRAGSSPIALASKFACQALRLIGEREPHKLSQQVPLWTCEDVCAWVAQIGFDRFKGAFRDSHVDGDLLLQLDEEALKFDLGLDNGLVRRRFLRELANLKRIADYSSVDKTSLGQLLVSNTSLMSPNGASPLSLAAGGGAVGAGALGANSCSGQQRLSATLSSSAQARNARDFLQYIYPLFQMGVTRDNIHLVDCDLLLAECRISNPLHRVKLAASIRELQDRILIETAASHERNSLGVCEPAKTLDVFVSYRRSTGSQLASLLKVHLQLRGFSVFIDVERLEAGKFDNNLLESIRMAKNFILVLSPNALDRCIEDCECKDWVHKEIVAALASNCNIIPIIDNFHWPDPEQLPEDMRSISYFNGVRWIHDYQDACVDKVERFIRGELSNGQTASVCGSSAAGGPPGSVGSAGATAAQYQRLVAAAGYSVSGVSGGGASTPSIISASTPSLFSMQAAGGAATGPVAGQQQQHSQFNGGASQQTPVAQSTAATSSGNSGALSAAKNLESQQLLFQQASEAGQSAQQSQAALSSNLYLRSSLYSTGNVNPNVRLR